MVMTNQPSADHSILKVLMPTMLLALGALNGWMAYILSSMDSRYTQMENKVATALISHATYQERVDRLQEAQAITAHLVEQLREDVRDHEYWIKSQPR